MKKLFALFLIIAFCYSAHSQKKVALVTFELSKVIGSGNLGENAAFLKDILTLADNPNFDLQPVLDDFYNEYKNDLSKEFSFELLPTEDVINDPEYKQYESKSEMVNQHYIFPEGFKILSRPMLGMGQQDKNNMIEIFKDKADGILMVFIGFEFNKTTMMGVGVAKINAYYNMVCYNMDGKKVFDLWRNADSKKSVPVAAGYPILKLEKIQPMCDSAAEALMDDVRKKLPKIAKKSSKKL